MQLQNKDANGDQLPLKQSRDRSGADQHGSADEQCRSYVAKARDGNQDAFRELYKRFFPMVHGILLSRVPGSEVDDLVQEVFLQAWRQLASLRDNRAFGTWLAQITRRRSVDHFRYADRAEQLPANLKVDPTDEESWFLLNAIRRLPEAYRETLIMRFVENLTGPEIALLTGLTPDSVRVNLHRGAALLRDQLKGAWR